MTRSTTTLTIASLCRRNRRHASRAGVSGFSPRPSATFDDASGVAAGGGTIGGGSCVGGSQSMRILGSSHAYEMSASTLKMTTKMIDDHDPRQQRGIVAVVE